MRSSWYAKALYELHTESKLDEAKLLKQFIGTVSANGHAHMLGKIMSGFERLVTKGINETTIEVRSAKEMTESGVLSLLKKEPFNHALRGTPKKVVRKTDPTIVGGTIVRSKTIRIDASHKRMLIDLYQSVISK